MKKRISLLLILAICIFLPGCGVTLPADTTSHAITETIATETNAVSAEDIVILYTNDIHAYIDGPLSYDVLAGLKDSLQKTYGNVLLVDVGDHIQGTAYGLMDKGESVIHLMNSAGYDLATLGNHEFDYSMEGTKDILEWAEFPYISCNFYHEKNGVRGENVLDSVKVFSLGGKKIAFVGITTPESFSKTTPAYFMDDMGNYIYGISGGEDGAALYADVQQAIDSADADVVIALGHLGDDASSYPWTAEAVIANVTGLDAFMDGHSHSTVKRREVADKDGKPVLLTQSGEYFHAIGMMVIDGLTGDLNTDLITYSEITEILKDESGIPVMDDEGREVSEIVGYAFESSFELDSSWCTDDDTAAMKEAWIQEINDKLGQVIGWTEVTLDNYDTSGTRMVRRMETNTGDFSADALYYLFDNMGLDVDVAVMNGGGIRNQAITGELTYLDAKRIHTFGNVACLMTVTGQQLLDALEWGSTGVGSGMENGSLLHSAGITYRIDADWPSSVQHDDKDVWTGAPTGGYRVRDVKVYNKKTNQYEPIDLEANYNLAGYNYTLRDLGGGFAMFSSAVMVLDYVMEDYMVLANYIQGFENSTVDAVNSPLLKMYPNMLINYADVQGSGRIIIE